MASAYQDQRKVRQIFAESLADVAKYPLVRSSDALDQRRTVESTAAPQLVD
jgi:hypothetical protein